jgi:hypothetical protein
MRLQETSISFDHSSYRYHYLCHYLSIATGRDTLSRSLMKFKRGAHPDLEAWIDYAQTALAEQPPLRDTIFIRALGHRERNAQDFPLSEPCPGVTYAPNFRLSALDHLCRTLALGFGCRYLPALLRKTRETIGNKNLSRADRAAELLDVYAAEITDATSSTPIMIIDDILTTGATVRAIIAALRRKTAACPIRVFTLARASYDPFSQQAISLRGPNYHFAPESGWVPGPSAATDPGRSGLTDPGPVASPNNS